MSRIALCGVAGMIAASVLASGCAAPMKVGPFVKSISRVGDALSIKSCEIVLDGHDLYQGQCFAQLVRLPAPGESGTSAPGAFVPAGPVAPAGPGGLASPPH